MKKALIFIFVSCTFFACATANNQNPIQFKDKQGEIKIVVKTRGVYQYLLQVEHEGEKRLYMPINLGEDFKKNGIKIQFSGTVLEEWTPLYKPGATDIPEKSKEVQNIRISSMKFID